MPAFVPLRRAALCALLALVSAVSGIAAFAQTADGELAGPALLAALRSGGYILYFRHASTDFGQSDEQMTGYEDCAKQRNLTDAGRAEARAIGEALRDLRIPIGDVLASPFCRTMETARLMFGRAQASAAVRGGPANAEGGRYDELKKILSQPVAPGANLVIASHGNPFRAVVGGPYLAEGEAAVIEPRGDGAFRVIARVTKDRWRALAARGA
jgi:phosphohistidine phosphatase SixA